ncbi:hypothetical protein SAMN02799622_03161 [Methylobacterium sp. UNC378MF]|nr:hypothetical protein SAMN02799622_03161 [Methylobacterium sp. UNC378MF]
MGDGRHGFDLGIATPLAHGVRHPVEVRRSADETMIGAMTAGAAGVRRPLLVAQGSTEGGRVRLPGAPDGLQARRSWLDIRNSEARLRVAGTRDPGTRGSAWRIWSSKRGRAK